MLEQFYPQHVLSRLQLGEEEYWEGRGLAVNDWTALASQLYIQIFSPNFVIPLHDTDTVFKLKVNECYCDIVLATVFYKATGSNRLGDYLSSRKLK